MSERASLPPVPHVPQRVTLDGELLPLVGLAEQVAARFLAEFPEDAERYGARGHEWCVHDNHYILAWAVADAEQAGVLERQLGWLAGLLEARGYPRVRLVRDLELAAEVVAAERTPARARVAARLRAGADLLRAGSLAG